MDVPDDTMITLIVKTPNLDVKDQRYECNKNWTVKSLKVYLSDVYPTKPSVENQRLIYFGHLLSDDNLLREVLNVNNSKTHTLHLVSPPGQNRPVMDENSVKHHTESSSEMENSAPEDTVTTDNSHSIASSYYSRNGDPRSHLPIYQMPLMYPGYTGNATDFAHQAALMQQMYMQYMAQCFQYAQSTGMYTGTTTAAAASQSVIGTETPPTTSQNVPEVQARTNVAENVQNNRPVRNVADVRAANRDMLDILYSLSRITILLSVIYFYSSLGRCLFVMGLGCLIYMYRAGLFSFRRERHRNEARHQLAQPRRNVLRHEPLTNRNRPRTTHGVSTNLAETRPRRNDQVTAVKTFFASFFSSLIPDQHHPVNVN